MNKKLKGSAYFKVPKVLHARLKMHAASKGEKLEDFVCGILWGFAKKPLSIPRSNEEE